MFLTFYSHLLTGITDPGSINYNNNLDIIEFYYFVYKDINIIKENINNSFLKNNEELLKILMSILDLMKNLVLNFLILN